MLRRRLRLRLTLHPGHGLLGLPTSALVDCSEVTFVDAPSGTGAAGSRKWISTSGLALTLILLFLPFAGVSCESAVGSVTAEITGWDMVVGGKPSVTTTGLVGIVDVTDADVDSVPVQPLMVLTVVAIVGAILLGLAFRNALAHSLGVGLASALAALLLVMNQTKVLNDMTEEIERGTDVGFATDWVGSRFGFWLTLGLLGLMTVYHLGRVVISRQARRRLAAARQDE